MGVTKGLDRENGCSLAHGCGAELVRQVGTGGVPTHSMYVPCEFVGSQSTYVAIYLPTAVPLNFHFSTTLLSLSLPSFFYTPYI